MTAASTDAMASMMALVSVLVYSSALTCRHRRYCRSAGYDRALADLHGKHSARRDADWPTFRNFRVKTLDSDCLRINIAPILLLEDHSGVS